MLHVLTMLKSDRPVFDKKAAYWKIMLIYWIVRLKAYAEIVIPYTGVCEWQKLDNCPWTNLLVQRKIPCPKEQVIHK